MLHLLNHQHLPLYYHFQTPAWLETLHTFHLFTHSQSEDGRRRRDADPSDQGMGKAAESAKCQRYRSGGFLRPAHFHLDGGGYCSGDLLELLLLLLPLLLQGQDEGREYLNKCAPREENCNYMCHNWTCNSHIRHLSTDKRVARVSLQLSIPAATHAHVIQRPTSKMGVFGGTAEAKSWNNKLNCQAQKQGVLTACQAHLQKAARFS